MGGAREQVGGVPRSGRGGLAGAMGALRPRLYGCGSLGPGCSSLGRGQEPRGLVRAGQLGSRCCGLPGGPAQRSHALKQLRDGGGAPRPLLLRFRPGVLSTTPT